MSSSRYPTRDWLFSSGTPTNTLSLILPSQSDNSTVSDRTTFNQQIPLIAGLTAVAVVVLCLLLVMARLIVLNYRSKQDRNYLAFIERNTGAGNQNVSDLEEAKQEEKRNDED